MIENDALTEKIIGAAIEVHRVLGPGLLESAYEECLCHELHLGGITFARQQPLPAVYKAYGWIVVIGWTSSVENRVIVELKTVDKILPIHEAQLLTYLRLWPEFAPA